MNHKITFLTYIGDRVFVNQDFKASGFSTEIFMFLLIKMTTYGIKMFVEERWRHILVNALELLFIISKCNNN